MELIVGFNLSSYSHFTLYYCSNRDFGRLANALYKSKPVNI